MQAVLVEDFGLLSQFLSLGRRDEVDASALIPGPATKAFSVLILGGCIPLARLLAKGLLAESIAVEITHDMEAALKHLGSATHDLIILDLDLPNSDPNDTEGAGLIAWLRDKHPDLRILALSGRSGIEGLVEALDHGADDYLPKPFSLLELLARVRALRRRSHLRAGVLARKTSVTLHPDTCQVERDGRLIDLTPRELRLLEYMMQNAGKTLTRAALTQDVWNLPAEGNTNIVDVYIKYLRDKLDEGHETKVIRTVRGTGYVFQATP